MKYHKFVLLAAVSLCIATVWYALSPSLRRVPQGKLHDQTREEGSTQRAGFHSVLERPDQSSLKPNSREMRPDEYRPKNETNDPLKTEVIATDLDRLKQVAVDSVESLWGADNEGTYGSLEKFELEELIADEPVLVRTLDKAAYYGPAFDSAEQPNYFIVRVEDEGSEKQFLQTFIEKTTEAADGTLDVERGIYVFGASNPILDDRPPYPLISQDEARMIVAQGLGLQGGQVVNIEIVNIPYPTLSPSQALYGVTTSSGQTAFVRLYDGQFFASRLDYERLMKQQYSLPNEFLAVTE